MHEAIYRDKLRLNASFYFSMSMLAALIIFAGFAPSFYLKSLIHAPPPLTLLTIVHGVIFTLWVLLFLTQVSLVAADNLALHRQIGILGAVMLGVVLTLGIVVAIVSAELGHAPPGAPPQPAFLVLPLVGITATFFLFLLALINRHNSEWHKRLMLSALFTMTVPATHRLAIPVGLAHQGTWIALGIAEALLVVAMIYDYTRRGRVHPAYWVAAATYVTLHLIVLWGYSSPTWLAFARSIT